MTEGFQYVLPALFGVTMPQVLHRIPRVFCVSAPSEAVAKVPRFVVKLRPLPLQALNHTILSIREYFSPLLGIHRSCSGSIFTFRGGMVVNLPHLLRLGFYCRTVFLSDDGLTS